MYNPQPLIIVDDDPDDQFVYTRLLGKIDYKGEVRYFDNGRDALLYLKDDASDPLLIISDVCMPGIDGLQLREAMLENETIRSRCTPFVFISGGLVPSEISRAKHLDGQGYFSKSLVFNEGGLRLIVEYWSSCLFHTI